MTVESVGFSLHFAFCSLGNRLASFFNVPNKAHLLSSKKTWQLCSPNSYKVFIEPSDTIVTPYLILQAPPDLHPFVMRV